MKIICFTSVLIIFLAYIPAYSGVFRWVDESGKVHYGDKIPPNVSQNGHTKLRENGLVSEKVESAAEKRRRKQLEELRKAREEIENEQKALQDEQDVKDGHLLAMFADTDELIDAYTKKLNNIDENIDSLKERKKKLSAKFVESRSEYMADNNEEKVLELTVDMLLKDLAAYEKSIMESTIEKAKLKQKYDSDLAKFQYLTAINKTR